MGNKSTNIEIEKRVTTLIPLVTMLHRREILQYVAKKTDWNVSERTVDEYIFSARKEIKKQYSEVKKTAIEQSLNNYKTLYKKSFSLQDFRTCATIEEKIGKLLGLYVEKQEIKTDMKIQGYAVEFASVNDKKNDDKMKDM